MDIGSANYIIARVPNAYGGKQEEYIAKTDEAINCANEKLKEAVRESRDLKKVFFELFDFFCDVRHEIALAHDTINGHHFGINRLHTIRRTVFTPLASTYCSFNERMIVTLQKYLKGTIPIKGEPRAKKFEFREEYEGSKSLLELEILTRKDIEDRFLNLHPHQYIVDAIFDQKNKDKINEISRKIFPTFEELQVIEPYQHHMIKLRQEMPQLYQQQIMRPIFECLQKASWAASSRQASMFVLAKGNIEIDGTMHPLSEYITWIIQDEVTDPVDRMKEVVVSIIHQDQYLIKKTLDLSAALFEKAILWKTEQGQKVLQDHASFFRFLFANATPACRGSAAIGENFEKLIYKFQEFRFRHNPATLGDVEALIAPLWPTFREKYPATIILENG